MGAYAPMPALSNDKFDVIQKTIIEPTVKGLQKESIEYKGVLYYGLMETQNGPQVLEFNCRFGDPETQPILFMLESDLIEVMQHTIEGTLDKVQLNWKEGFASCIVATSKGYPGKYEKGEKISGLNSLPSDIKVFHAGTREDSGELFTNGGRVFGVTGWGDTLQNALNKTYDALKNISFDGIHYRKDIGFRVLNNE